MLPTANASVDRPRTLALVPDGRRRRHCVAGVSGRGRHRHRAPAQFVCSGHAVGDLQPGDGGRVRVAGCGRCGLHRSRRRRRDQHGSDAGHLVADEKPRAHSRPRFNRATPDRRSDRRGPDLRHRRSAGVRRSGRAGEPTRRAALPQRIRGRDRHPQRRHFGAGKLPRLRHAGRSHGDLHRRDRHHAAAGRRRQARARRAGTATAKPGAVRPSSGRREGET